MSQAFSQREFRDAMGQFCTGVAVVTGRCPEGPTGFAVQSFVSVSLSPPLIAICPAVTGNSWARLRSVGHFGINILRHDQEELCLRFGVPGAEKFDNLRCASSDRGIPVLDDTLAYVECQLESEHEAGDHTVVIGRVEDFRIFQPNEMPLLFFRGGYGHFASSAE